MFIFFWTGVAKIPKIAYFVKFKFRSYRMSDRDETLKTKVIAMYSATVF
jgi:hypothetical protein